MKPKSEKIQLLPEESFRLLQWHRNIHDVEIVAADGAHHPLKGSGHEWHHHSHMELTLVTQGSGTLFIGDAITHFKAPDLVLIGPNLPHYWHMRHTSSGYAIQFDFEPEHAFWQLPETMELRDLWHDARRGLHLSGPVVAEIEALIRSGIACGGMGRLARFIQILVALLKTSPKTRNTISSTTFVPPIRQSTYRSLQKAIYLVFHNFHEDLSFTDVLRETRMSKSTFERHFKKHTGKTFTRFVTEVRLNFASRQLIETDLSVSEIALASGYNNISHFNHQFNALHALSPRAFRKQMKATTLDCGMGGLS
jgi:AraC-like DNA-binding protein/mannose-6-phosphate isomerase-like protein (cupin superfamily)